MLITSMIVDNLDPLCISLVPQEADPPLVIDADAVLTLPVTTQCLQSIAGWSGQVAQFLRLMDLSQLTLGNPLYVVRQPPREPAVEQPLGVAIGERADHARRLYTRRVYIVNSSTVTSTEPTPLSLSVDPEAAERPPRYRQAAALALFVGRKFERSRSRIVERICHRHGQTGLGDGERDYPRARFRSVRRIRSTATGSAGNSAGSRIGAPISSAWAGMSPRGGRSGPGFRFRCSGEKIPLRERKFPLLRRENSSAPKSAKSMRK
jgi:hypothetical protein